MNEQKQHDEARIRQLHEEFERAIAAKDLDRILAQYADELVAFDAIGPLQFKGVADYRAHWQRCFEFCQGEGFFETHELHVEVVGHALELQRPDGIEGHQIVGVLGKDAVQILGGNGALELLVKLADARGVLVLLLVHADLLASG